MALKQILRGNNSLSAKGIALSALLTEQAMIEGSIDRTLAQREVEFSDRFNHLVTIFGENSDLSPGMAEIFRRADSRNLDYQQRRKYLFIKEFYNHSQSNSLLWTSWLNSFKGEFLKLENRSRYQQMISGEFIRSNHFKKSIDRKIKKRWCWAVLSIGKIKC